MADEPSDRSEPLSVLELACTLIGAYVRKNQLPAADVPAALRSVYCALAALPFSPPPAARPHAIKPAVPIKKSVKNEYIICLEDGRKLKMLKRYLHTRYGLTPDQYREKWNLPSTYPMTAPKYAAVRSVLAKKVGLGHRSAK